MSSRDTSPESKEDDSDHNLLSARPTANTRGLAIRRLGAGENAAGSSKRLLEDDSGGFKAPTKRSKVVERSKIVESSDRDNCLVTLPDLREFEGALSRPGKTEIGLSQVLGNLHAARHRS